MIYICNFHVLSHLLLIYVCKLHWNLRVWLEEIQLAIFAIHITSPEKLLPGWQVSYPGSISTPELSQLNQDLPPRYKLGLFLPRNCHKFTRTASAGLAAPGRAGYSALGMSNRGYSSGRVSHRETQRVLSRYKLGLTIPRNCHNLTRISTPAVYRTANLNGRYLFSRCNGLLWHDSSSLGGAQRTCCGG